MECCRKVCKGACLVTFAVSNLGYLAAVCGFFAKTCVNVTPYKTIIDKQFLVLCIITIIFCLMIIIICIVFGYVFGVWKQNYKCLLAYSFLLFGLCPCLLAVGIMSFTFRNVQVKQSAADLFEEYTTKGKQRKIINEIQAENSCCGPYGPQDWIKVLPDTCCEFKNCTEKNSYRLGCVEAITHWFDREREVFGALAFFVTIVTIIFGCFGKRLSRKIKAQQEQ